MSILNITNKPGSTYQFAYDVVKNNTNMVGSAIGTKLGGLAASTIGSLTAIPQVTQIAQSAIDAGTTGPGFMYTAVPYTNLNSIPGVAYQDFRSRKGYSEETLLSTRLDGAALAARQKTKRWLPILYAGLSASPLGAYSTFNRDADNPFGFGWGDHGNIYALRNDFTAQSHVATTWDIDKWKNTKNPISRLTPFRGDRVQVIDFKRNVTLNDTYKWNDSILGAVIPNLGITQDFIKFFFTGPNLAPGQTKLNTQIDAPASDSSKDNIMVFRAAITSLTDSFNPSWNPVQMIGRADPNFHYTAYSRDITLSFSVYATDRDEMKPIWRKLNALAGYTAPKYSDNTISLEAPWIRMTIGDLFFQQPCIIQSLTYTLHDTDTTWEINIEKDESMMQVPKKIDVNMGLTIITNELPETDGKFYTLAKQFDPNSAALRGNDNWLSDFKGNNI